MRGEVLDKVANSGSGIGVDHPAFQGVSLRGAWALLFVIWVSSCSLSDRQEAPKPLLADGQTHLEFTWPAVRDEAPELNFRIPREDIDLSLAPTRTDRGGIRTLFLKMRWPPDGVLQQKMSPAKFGATYSSEPSRQLHSRRTIELFWALNNNQARREHFDLWAYKCNSCMWDGQIGGLQRYSRMYCPNPESLPERGQLSQREPDDPSPPGCYLNRKGSYLSNSIEDDLGERAIEIRCLSGICEMSLQINDRTVLTNLQPTQFAYATELADAIRSQVSSYIVK